MNTSVANSQQPTIDCKTFMGRKKTYTTKIYVITNYKRSKKRQSNQKNDEVETRIQQFSNVHERSVYTVRCTHCSMMSISHKYGLAVGRTRIKTRKEKLKSCKKTGRIQM